MLTPLQSRLIIKPEPASTMSAGGILFPETHGKAPAMTGVVMGIGKGPASAHRVRQATIAHCLHLVETVAEQVPASTLRSEVADAFARYAAEDARCSELHVGDMVCFAYTAGHNMTVDGEPYIVIDERDVQAVWKEESV